MLLSKKHSKQLRTSVKGNGNTHTLLIHSFKPVYLYAIYIFSRTLDINGERTHSCRNNIIINLILQRRQSI